MRDSDLGGISADSCRVSRRLKASRGIFAASAYLLGCFFFFLINSTVDVRVFSSVAQRWKAFILLANQISLRGI